MQVFWTILGYPTGLATLDDQQTPDYVTIFGCFQYLPGVTLRE